MSDQGRARLAAAAGLGACVVAGIGFGAWPGLTELQATTTAADFAAVAHDPANRVRLASLTDIVLFVPGYVLLVGGLFAVASDDRRAAPGGPAPAALIRRLASLGRRLVVVGAVADQVENGAVQLGLGLVDLRAGGSDVVAPAGWVLAVMRAGFLVKNSALVLAVVALVAVAALLVAATIRARRGPTARAGGGRPGGAGRIS